MKDNRDLLKEPLHSIYIPIALVIGGTSIFGFGYLPYTLSFVAVICIYKVAMSLLRRSSLHKTKWQEFELIDKTLIARNALIFRFKLNREDEVLDIRPGHNVACCFTIDGKDEVRYYLPILNQFDAGFFDILVKHYENGVVLRHMAKLQTGNTVMFRGPFGILDYKPNMTECLGLIAGGSGITPLLQVITEIITNPEDDTRISLLYANETERDILLKSEIDEIAAKYPGFSVHYTLTFPPEKWAGSVGNITREMLAEHLPLPSDNLERSQLMVCGPPEMKNLVETLANESGWHKDAIFSF